MDEIEEFVARHGLSAEAAAELRALLPGPGGTLVPSTSGTATLLDAAFDDPTADGEDEPSVDQRYEDLGLLGTGGMSEVRRVKDVRLRRILAMKIADPVRARHPSALARFVDEAQTTAQLDHPGVVPVHELGRTADGRLYFTMKEVRGRTLREVVADLHRASPPGAWGETADGWSLYRLLDAWRSVCETVAHAHARGVIHRDLKPDNVMVGAFGEVLVLDWGLARSGASPAEPELEPVVTDRTGDDALRTRAGTLAGTPMYMSPEQARGELDRLDARSDVYALGVVLYELLYGEPPYPTGSVSELLEEVTAARVEPPEAPPRPVPAELVELWRDCTEPERDARPADASVLARRMRRWQEGAERRERAMAILGEASRVLPEVERLRQRARLSRDEATRLAAGVAAWEPVERKRDAWAREDEAAGLELRAELEELRATELLRAALTQAPDLAEARERLANLYRRRFADAEARGDTAAAARFEVLLRTNDDGRHAAWLRGEGALTLLTDPPGASVELFRYELRDRRRVPVPYRALPPTPLRAHPLPMGSYLAVLRAPGRAEVRYPIRVDRRGQWDGVAPGTSAAFPVRLPRADELGPDDVLVPAGWFRAGGDPRASQPWPSTEEWVGAFVIRRFPVTNAEYLAFLDDLVRRGREEEALRCAPRGARPGGQLAEPVYGRRADGGFELRADAQGDRWEADWPVLLVDRPAAEAFAAWEAERTGLPWRLPTEHEWEKAARGVDGREFPWGSFLDPTWCCMRDSRPGRHLPAPVTAFADDESPYGVRGMAGNARIWCAGSYEEGTEGAPVRGGAWSFSEVVSRCASRSRVTPDRRSEQIGLRLARGA